MLIAKATLNDGESATILGINSIMISRLKGGESVIAEGREIGIDGKLILMYGNSDSELQSSLENRAEVVSDGADVMSYREIISRAEALKKIAEELAASGMRADKASEAAENHLLAKLIAVDPQKLVEKLTLTSNALSEAAAAFVTATECAQRIAARSADESSSH